MTAQILLVDDDAELIKVLRSNLQKQLSDDDVEVELWVPSKEDHQDPDLILEQKSSGTELVVTDYDLTKKGMRGFQGTNVRNWCQRNLIPVGDFSRGNQKSLPDEPDLFSMRVPVIPEELAAPFIATVYRGFSSIRAKVNATPLKGTNLSAMAAIVLGRPKLEPSVSLYFSRLASSTPWIRKRLSEMAEEGSAGHREDTAKLVSYVLGHAIQNLILAFPGPLMNLPVLAAYLSTLPDDANEFVQKASLEAYTGPFADLGPYYWREEVDEFIDRLVDGSEAEPPSDESLVNHFALGLALGRIPTPHKCSRGNCEGKRGGFWCPFTKRPVCVRGDCSEATTAWIPDGADLCRVEKDFFDEFAPLLGL